MDDVCATLILLPRQPIPGGAHEASALVYVPDAESPEHSADEIRAVLELGPPVYIALPPIEEASLKDYLAAFLLPGVYGIASRTPQSVDQLRYVESLLEELEIRNGIRPGLTAMAVGFEDPKSLTIMADALQAMRDSADRMTWIAFNHVELAEKLSIPPSSPTIDAAAAHAIVTASAFSLPVVFDDPEQAERAALQGFRGCATIETSDLARLREIFAPPEPLTEEDS